MSSCIEHVTITLPEPEVTTVVVKLAEPEVTSVRLAEGLPVPVPGPPGPPGPAGPPGSSTSVFEYSYSSSVTTPPGNSQLRSDGDTPATTTVIWIDEFDIDGINRKPFLMVATPGSQIYTQDKSDADAYAWFTLDSDPIDNGTYVTLNVTYDRGGTGTLTKNKRILFGLLRPGVPGPPGPPGDAAVTAYRHVQAVPSTTWTIPHNLGFYPNVAIVDASKRAVIGDIEYSTDGNTVTVRFSAAFSGEAFIS